MNTLLWKRKLRATLLTACASVFVAFVGASVLELGAWQRKEVVYGPFPTRPEAPQHLVAIGRDVPFQPLFDAGFDYSDRGARSDLRLAINGESLGNTRDAERRFAHWGGFVYFDLPKGVANDSSVVVTAKYSVRLAPGAYNILAAASLIALVYCCALVYLSRVGRQSLLGPTLTSVLVLPLDIVSYLAVAGGLAYAGTIGYGVWSGHPVPTATVFALHPSLRALTSAEVLVTYGLLVFAGAGVALAWLGRINFLNSSELLKTTGKLHRLWGWWGLPCLVLLLFFTLSGGGWSGSPRAIDQNYMSIAGLIPQSDALGYYETSFVQSLVGTWTSLGARRPVAQAFRDATVLAANQSYIHVLLIQSVVLAAAIFLSARALAQWRGPWTALAFVGLVLIVLRPFLFTTLTEPLAIIVILWTIPWLVAALRFGSLPHAMVAVAGTTAALSIRMGAMLVLPVLMVWAAFCFRSRARPLVVTLALAAAAAGTIIVTGFILGSLYAPPGALLGANFSYTVCGLSLGADWSECAYRRYASDIARLTNEKEAAAFLYRAALSHIADDPTVFLRSLARNAVGYVSSLPSFHLNGYYFTTGHPALPQAIPRYALVATVPGLLFILIRRSSWPERLLWAGLFIGTVSSAAVIMADDGWRVLMVTHILMAIVLAIGFATPARPLDQGLRRPRWEEGAAVIGGFLILLLVAPALLHRASRAALRGIEFPPLAVNEVIVGGGRRVAGFAVIAEDAPRLSRYSVPAPVSVREAVQGDAVRSESRALPRPSRRQGAIRLRLRPPDHACRKPRGRRTAVHVLRRTPGAPAAQGCFGVASSH